MLKRFQTKKWSGMLTFKNIAFAFCLIVPNLTYAEEAPQIPVPVEIIGDAASKIMTEGIILNVQFTREETGSDIDSPVFLYWHNLLKYNDQIYLCRVTQMVLYGNVFNGPYTICLNAE